MYKWRYRQLVRKQWNNYVRNINISSFTQMENSAPDLGPTYVNGIHIMVTKAGIPSYAFTRDVSETLFACHRK